MHHCSRRWDHIGNAAIPDATAVMPGFHLRTGARLPEARRRRVNAGATTSHNTAQELSIVQTWVQLRNEIVATLGVEFEEALHHISLDDIHWPAWRNCHLEGRSPPAAEGHPLERDL